MSEITDNKNTIIEAVRPDYTGYDQPLIIRYQGFDNTNYEATNPVDIICIPQASHIDPNTECAYNQDILSFTVLDSYLGSAYVEGNGLIEAQSLAVEFVVMRDNDGNWNNMDGGTDDTSSIHCIVEAPNGDIYVGGTFSGMNGVANTAYLAKWDGNDWSTVTGADILNGTVYDLTFDAEGNLYIGGGFTDVGDVNGDYIIKWDGTNVSSLGSGMNGHVRALAIDPATGYLYVGGTFTLAGGVANTAKIAYWDGSVWNPLSTGLNDSVFALGFAPNGDLYIGGAFTNADGANGDYLCYWNGTSFNMLGDTELTDTVYSIAFDNNGLLIIGGTFLNAGSNANADCIAIWSGGDWESFGTGLSGGSVRFVTVDKYNRVYACGSFTSAGGLALADRIAYYVNDAWYMLDVDLPGSGYVYSILIDSYDNFYAGGVFSSTSDGNAITGKVATCTNSGNSKVFPTIEIKGPGILQSITNYSTGKEIQFDGLTLQAGEIITIQPVSGQVLITSNWGGRGYMQKYVNPGSDIGSFYLKPGTNYISLFMPSDTTAATQAFIYWTPKFWNIEGSRYE
jgi:hypothetical protein